MKKTIEYILESAEKRYKSLKIRIENGEYELKNKLKEQEKKVQELHWILKLADWFNLK
jgi:hypothetical protein